MSVSSVTTPMISAIIFDLLGTLIRLTRDSQPYLSLCRATDSFRVLAAINQRKKLAAGTMA